jgi:homoserine kinase
VIFRTIAHVFRKAGRHLPPIALRCVNRIPLARGLGSSSAAYLAGLLAGNHLVGNRFSDETILDMATELEGHPDNVAPALYGGARASGVIDGRVVSFALPLPEATCVVAIPDFQLSTKKARAVLPARVPLQDAVFNLAAVSLMPFAFKQPTLLAGLLNDRVHEPYRAKLVPGFFSVKKAALKAGALGVTLSGAGPTMLGFCPKRKAASIGAAMQAAFKRAGVKSQVLKLAINKRGAVVR